MLDGQQIQRQLTQATPNIDLVGVVVAGGDLFSANDGGVGIGIGRAAVGRALGAMRTAVGFLIIKPDQPGAVDLLHRRDLAGQNIGHRAFLVGTDAHRIARRFVHDNVQRFGQRCAIFRCVDQFCGKAVLGLHIDAGHSGGGLHIGRVQHAGRVLYRGKVALSVKREQGNVIRQDHLGGTVVGGVLHLDHDRHDSVVLAALHRYRDAQPICVEGFGVHAAGALIGEQTFRPEGQSDLGIAGGNRQAIAAQIVAGGCIRQVAVEDVVDLIVIRRRAGVLGQLRLLHRQLHRGDQRRQGGVGGLHRFALLFFFGDGIVQVFGGVHRRRRGIGCGDRFVQCSFQISAVWVGLPGGARGGPLAYRSQNRFPIQGIDGIHKSLRFGAERRFGCGGLRRGRSGHGLCGRRVGTGRSFGKRRARRHRKTQHSGQKSGQYAAYGFVLHNIPPVCIRARPWRLRPDACQKQP